MSAFEQLACLAMPCGAQSSLSHPPVSPAGPGNIHQAGSPGLYDTVDVSDSLRPHVDVVGQAAEDAGSASACMSHCITAM